MTEPQLLLTSDSLLSKWGFNDGDLPDDIWDAFDERGIQYVQIDWHHVLTTLVREHLLPALDQVVTLVAIETNHNPIRAETVDGVDVTEGWYETSLRTRLTPEYVTVPFAEVLRATLEEGEQQ